ncbi:MAG: Rpn family recombination-promoting nuclease/putative transposase [Planctomycetota bacterium]|nr:Rpn family recombination-promoting nuclease/putative transposase [Planctomycetota bacterium]
MAKKAKTPPIPSATGAPKILLPVVDMVFKWLFGNEKNSDLLADFLQAVLHIPAGEFDKLVFVDPHLQREALDDKLGILDVKIKTASGKIIDVEIQVLEVEAMRSRLTYYLAKMITEQMHSGKTYDVIKPSVSIVIANFPLITETARFHTVFSLLENTEHFPFNDLLEIDVLDLTKLPKGRAAPREESSLVDWLAFIGAQTEEEFTMASAKNPVIKKAFGELMILSADERKRMLYESRLKLWRDEQSRLQGAKREGKREGKKEGIEIGREKEREFFLSLLKSGKTPLEILTIIGR